jgi:hypothetical protein
MAFTPGIDMDTINYKLPLKNGWQENATYVMGITLHPDGEKNAVQFIMEAQGSLKEMQQRYASLVFQCTCSAFTAYVFIYNTIISARQFYRRRTLLAICCLIQALAGIAYSASNLLFFSPFHVTCRHEVWIATFGIIVSNLCTFTILLQKAYIACNHNRWLLTLGIILMMPQPQLLYFFWTSPIMVRDDYGCVLNHPTFLPWLKLAVDLPINLVLSLIFIAAIHRQYRQFGSEAWRKLIHDGTRSMCAVLISNIVCMFGIAFSLAGPQSDVFFVIDWVVTSCLLVRYISRRRSTSYESNRPKTRQALNGFSEITSLDESKTEAMLTLSPR